MGAKITIENLGYDAFFESSRVKSGLDFFQIARVISEFKGAYKIKNEAGEFMAKITGRQIFKAASREDYPAVGDWVEISDVDPQEKKAMIQSIFPRKTMIKRKSGMRDEAQLIATNIDVAFIVQSVGRDYNLNRFERYFAIAKDGGIQPIIILNKVDLISEEELHKTLSEIKTRFKDAPVVSTSTLTDKGLEDLRTLIKKGQTYCFLGSSGVGKSSIINKLVGEEKIKTGSIGARSARGKHVTTTREMYFLESGGILIDNPGIREVGMSDTHSGIDNFFDEITALSPNCKFMDCTHVHEPGCAVLAAVESGTLDGEKYSNYINLKKEVGFFELSANEKRQKDRKFGKFMKNAKKDLKNYQHKDFGN